MKNQIINAYAGQEIGLKLRNLRVTSLIKIQNQLVIYENDILNIRSILFSPVDRILVPIYINIRKDCMESKKLS